MGALLNAVKKWFNKDKQEERARQWYIASVAQARKPFFYTKAGVPDTLDGRFDMIVLHLHALINTIKSTMPDDATQYSRLIAEMFFADMDRNLREMGVGDVGVGRRIRNMSEALYGRFNAYDEAQLGTRSLSDVLMKNIYANAQPSENAVKLLEDYIHELRTHLVSLDADELRKESLFQTFKTSTI